MSEFKFGKQSPASRDLNCHITNTKLEKVTYLTVVLQSTFLNTGRIKLTELMPKLELFLLLTCYTTVR